MREREQPCGFGVTVVLRSTSTALLGRLMVG